MWFHIHILYALLRALLRYVGDVLHWRRLCACVGGCGKLVAPDGNRRCGFGGQADACAEAGGGEQDPGVAEDYAVLHRGCPRTHRGSARRVGQRWRPHCEGQFGCHMFSMRMGPWRVCGWPIGFVTLFGPETV